MNKEQFKFNVNLINGELDCSKIPKDMLEGCVKGGLFCEVRVSSKRKYFVNPFLIPGVNSNITLMSIFDRVEYCVDNTCSKYGNYDNIHPDCNTCINRRVASIEESINQPFTNEKDNYVMGEPPADIENNSDEYMEYRKYLHTEYWKNFREEVFKYYGKKCNWCGTSGDDITLNVHHARYGERFNEKIENVIPLCATCHRKAHGIY